MSKEKLIKQIDFECKIKDHLWNAMILSLGGTIGLSLNSDSSYKKILICIGILFSLIFFVGYFKKDDGIENLFKKLEE